MKVDSVSPTLEPYNPQLTNQGIPAEQVNFVVSSVTGLFSCTIKVLRSGHIVGTTVAGFGEPTGPSRSVTESVAVEGIKGPTFSGNGSSARVTCQRP